VKKLKVLSFLVSVLLLITFSLSACSGINVTGTDKSEVKQEGTSETDNKVVESQKEKPNIVLLIKNNTISWNEEYLKKIEEKFPQYKITFKDTAGADSETLVRTVKTLGSSGGSLEVVAFWPQSMGTFVDADMALDLTPYLEENNGEWKNTFQEGSLDLGKFNGKYYNIPYAANVTMIVANKTIFDEYGVELPEGGPMEWDEFSEISKQIKEKSNGTIFPFGTISQLKWMDRNGFLSIWSSQEEIDKFTNGEIPMNHPNIVKVLENTKYFFDNEFVYPGKGALVVKQEEVNSAFKQGKIAMVACTNTQIGQLTKELELDIDNIKLLDWPKMGPMSRLLGGGDGYFIPSFTKYKNEAIEVLKYMTSPETMQLAVNYGVPVNVKGVTNTDDPLYPEYTRGVGYVNGREILHLSTKMYEASRTILPEYLNNGASALEYFEQIRLEAIADREQ